MFSRILVANRGEIAARIIATVQRLGLTAVAVYSEPDRFTLPVRAAQQTVALGGSSAAESYLNVDAIVAAALTSGADAVHPGYGFLSENVAFAERLAAAGITFIGPRVEHLRAFGLKHTARELALRAELPLLPGSGLLDDAAAALTAAERIGYPVMLKSTAGGGVQRRARAGRQAGRRRFLDDFLMSPLQRAVALAQRQHAAPAVAEDLHFDMPRGGDELFEVHAAVAEIARA